MTYLFDFDLSAAMTAGMSTVIFTLLFIDFFDTAGTLTSVANVAGKVDKNGKVQDINKAMLSDSVGTVAGAMMGTTTVTSYVESGAGVKAGGKTGMTSLVIGLLFLACIFFAPLATSLPKQIDGAALLFVSVLFIRNITDIEWNDISESAPAILAMIAMPLTYSISNGIALAFVSYALIKIFTGKFSSTSPAIWVVAILSVIWTLGLMAFLGVKQNIVSTMLPVFLISIGVADTIHVLTEFNHEAKSKPRKQAVFDTLKSLWTPMVITTLTTAVGFLSLMSTDIVFIKEFGLFVAIGVIFALIITVLLLPPVLLKLAKTKSIDTNISQFEQESRSERCILVVNRLIAERKKSFLLVITMLMVGCGFSLSQLNIDNKAIKYFDEESQVRIDDEIINQYFAGSMVFSLTLKSNQPDTFKQAENLRKIEQIQHRLAEHADVGFSYSAVDFIKLLNQRLNEDNIDKFKLPIDEGYLVGQYFFLYESSDGRGVFDTVDPTYQTARIIVFNHSDQSTVVEKTLNDVLLFAQTILPENIEIEASGFGELLVSTKNEVIYGQITSLSMSLLGVVILLSIMFKSFKFGVLGAVPLSLTVYFNFSIMPLIGMDLDIGTALVAAIAIGVGVDYAIHFISRFLQHKNMGSNTESAIEAALKAVFRPIIFNTLVLSLGFSVLGFSTFAALANLGYLVAMTMLLSAIATLFILPTLVRLLSEKYLTIPKTTQLNLEGFSK